MEGASAANWALLSSSTSSAFSPRYASAAVVVNAPSPLAPTTFGSTSNTTTPSSPKVLLLGGDDYSYELHKNALPLSLSDRETTGGGLLNDVWVMDPSDLQRTYYFATHGVENGNAGYLRGSSSPTSADFVLQFHWNETNPGQNPPASTSYDDWIVDSNNIGAGETMWSPRRGHGAAVTHDDSIYVIGGKAREQIRVEDHHLVGGLRDHRIETLRDHSSQREEVVLQNDVWRSTDGLGVDWELVNSWLRRSPPERHSSQSTRCSTLKPKSSWYLGK